LRTRWLTWLGTLLLLLGVGVMIGVGISYARSNDAAPAHSVVKSWSARQIDQARELSKKIGYQNSHLFGHVKSVKISLGEPAVRMRIPKIGLDAPVVTTAVVNGVWQVADWAVGWLQGTAAPGQVGNMAFAAHDDIKGEIFKRIWQLSPGDKVFLYTRHMVFTYVVDGQQTVSPNDNSVLGPSNQRELSMITCTPYWVDTNRLVVTAKLASAHPIA